MTESRPDQPTNQLMEFVLGLVTSLLMSGTMTDADLARRAAMEAIAAYQARKQDELVTVAQILGFALTSLDNLRLSMATNLSLSMKLKLRGNANALNRAALHSTQSLERSRRGMKLAVVPAPAKPATTNAAPARQPEDPKPVVKPTTSGQENRRNWAIAMQKQAAELRVRSPNTPAAQRKTNTLWAEVLTEVANELNQPVIPRPAMSKTDLMRSTLLAGSPGFPTHFLARDAAARKRKA